MDVPLTYRTFAFIHLFSLLAAERGWKRRFHPSGRRSLGFLLSVFFIDGLMMSGFSRLMKLTGHINESLDQSSKAANQPSGGGACTSGL